MKPWEIDETVTNENEMQYRKASSKITSLSYAPEFPEVTDFGNAGNDISAHIEEPPSKDKSKDIWT